ncbi:MULTISPECIES: hypothetical protein [Micromonospora]|uniref:hypothetical protein n=1 Tax=Micromonospora TaxID=1873 RepID=UPI00248B3F33|nr:hypothetical protein [Micromonospora sp. WMMC264]WBB88166.1 hypothetical protein O7542_13740 [Micromonospora sp. WMMC264]
MSGQSSASPAHERAFGQEEPSRIEDLVRWVWEGLELPGVPSDYHFLLQHAVEKLWSRRIEAPAALYHLEVFSGLDLALLEAAPELARIDRPGEGPEFFRITSLERLLSLLEREGALRDAVALSRRASRFGDRYRLVELEAKLSVLDREAR